MPAPENQLDTATTAPQRWLSIIGIGEDGVDGLSATARGLIANAELVVGGKRHLALAQELITANQLPWPSPLTDAFDNIAKLKGRPVVVLASGDPFHYGVGTIIAQHFSTREMLCIPQPSAFSLSAARMGWSIPDTALVTLHGRPLENLNRHLHPGARILALSWDGSTPEKVATLLRNRGLGDARITILESLAGPGERVTEQSAAKFTTIDVDPLNTLAIELPITVPKTAFACLAPGLDDAAFEHDGQLTKRDIRAITISALAPQPGQLLWDIGLGAGSISIEWLLCHPSMRAIGYEHDKTRAARALANACTLGAPDLEVVTGQVPETLKGQPAPDTVFIGGGLSTPGTFKAAWNALKPGGRLVANAVTLESEAILADLHTRFKGELLKIQIARAAPVGTMRGWRTPMPVVQWRVTKP